MISASNLKVARDYIKGEGLYPTAIYRTNGEETKQTGGKKNLSFLRGFFQKGVVQSLSIP